MGVGMRVRAVVRPCIVAHDLEPAVRDASRGKDALGKTLELVAPTAQDDDLEAPLLVQVNVKRGSDAVAELML
jgi:hypothetical protein